MRPLPHHFKNSVHHPGSQVNPQTGIIPHHLTALRVPVAEMERFAKSVRTINEEVRRTLVLKKT